MIVLENEGYGATFGDPAADPYLAQALPAQGALLEGYYATGHESNENYVSLVSGQPPNAQNQADCPQFDNFAGATMLDERRRDGQRLRVPGGGAEHRHPALRGEKELEGVHGGHGQRPQPRGCGVRAPGRRKHRRNPESRAGRRLRSRHDPFVYFHSVIDEQQYCDRHVVALGSPSGAMPRGRAARRDRPCDGPVLARRTPRFSFITPDLCDDGHDSPCTNEQGGSLGARRHRHVPGNLGAEDHGLARLPRNGLLEIVFDEAASTETEACCEEMPGPGSPLPGITGPGGGRVGAVLLSPFITPGTVTSTAYNHYSSLASWETLLGVPRLADAATVPSAFGEDIFTASPRR